jgi:hypothetical protein
MNKILSILLIFSFAYSGEIKLEINLNKKCLFFIGDNIEYARFNYNDANWEKIKVPEAWENCGYPGYDGFAWYRIHVQISDALKNKLLILQLGMIDDVDQVYFNGELLNGSGRFPPDYQTAYGFTRRYPIPENLIHYGDKNIIAIRVYDHGGEGGIVSGKVGIFSDPSGNNFLMNLSGSWKFSLGDNMDRVEMDYDDSDWKNVMVPMKWEQFGYPDHDGYAWYRKKIVFSQEYSAIKLILVLGKIDDMDEIYFNGVRIGRTGYFPGEEYKGGFNTWDKMRYYFLPPHLIHWNRENIIAVRVYDIWGDGGIYEGPIGIISREQYLKINR